MTPADRGERLAEQTVDQSDLVPESRSPEYLRKLKVLLSVATFFNGYDGFLLPFVLPLLLGSLGGSESQAGEIRAVVGVGAVLGFLRAVLHSAEFARGAYDTTFAEAFARRG